LTKPSLSSGVNCRHADRGRPRPVNDTWVAACCLVHGIAMATFNVKDYTDFATQPLQLGELRECSSGPGDHVPTSRMV
jgi:hypothetical protein